MNKKRFYLILVLILLISSLLALSFHQKIGVQEVVNNKYENNKGLIKNYAKNGKVQYLSESIGQYLSYLLLVEDEKEFKQQVAVLKKNFLVKQADGTFIQWVATNQTTTNASVDDFRIIAVLKKASEQFQEPAYQILADELEETLISKQLTDGLIVDFYDWELQKKAAVLHLSYIDDQIIKTDSKVNKAKYQKILMESVDSDTPFFKEVYTLEEQTYQLADKKSVNLIDQLMIAIQYVKVTNQTPAQFDQWLKEEWDTKGKFFGGYLRTDLTPAVPYESSAVYALATLYFKLVHEEAYAEQLHQVLLKQSPFDKNADYATIHFFDYMWVKTVDVLYKKDLIDK